MNFAKYLIDKKYITWEQLANALDGQESQSVGILTVLHRLLKDDLKTYSAIIETCWAEGVTPYSCLFRPDLINEELKKNILKELNQGQVGLGRILVESHIVPLEEMEKAVSQFHEDIKSENNESKISVGLKTPTSQPVKEEEKKDESSEEGGELLLDLGPAPEFDEKDELEKKLKEGNSVEELEQELDSNSGEQKEELKEAVEEVPAASGGNNIFVDSFLKKVDSKFYDQCKSLIDGLAIVDPGEVYDGILEEFYDQLHFVKGGLCLLDLGHLDKFIHLWEVIFEGALAKKSDVVEKIRGNIVLLRDSIDFIWKIRNQLKKGVDLGQISQGPEVKAEFVRIIKDVKTVFLLPEAS